MRVISKWAAATALSMAVGGAQAIPLFQGRDGAGLVDNSCTATGVTRCAMFWNPTLDITILNDFSLGTGDWDPAAGPGSAQALAASAGLAATGLAGWVLPTGDGTHVAGPSNQFLSIWNDAGANLAALQAQFHAAFGYVYWSDSPYTILPGHAWFFRAGFGTQGTTEDRIVLNALAVHPGDVAALIIPEPHAAALMLLGLGATLAVVRRRQRR